MSVFAKISFALRTAPFVRTHYKMGETATHAAKVLDGVAIAAKVTDDLKARVSALLARGAQRPELAVVLVGSREDSAVFVKRKAQAAENIGVGFRLASVSAAECTTATLMGLVRQLNADKSVTGLVVQLPLPDSVDTNAVISAIDPQKDVDGYHEDSIGLLAVGSRAKGHHVGATPRGVMHLLREAGASIQGQRALVIGRSRGVGMQIALLLQAGNATVSVAHRHTPARVLEDLVRSSEIVVSAAGVAGLVRGDWIAPGSFLIDVGMTSVPDSSRKSGFRWVGDIEYDVAKEKAAAITPMPGGVGPMTVSMLLANLVDAAEFAFEKK